MHAPMSIYPIACACLCAVHAFSLYFLLCIPWFLDVVCILLYRSLPRVAGSYSSRWSVQAADAQHTADSATRVVLSVGLCSWCTRTLSFPRRARWLPDTPHLLFYGSRLLVEIIHIVVLRISSVLLVSSSRSYISSSQSLLEPMHALCHSWAIGDRD